MARAVQQRTLKTRARLTGAARQIITECGYEGLRIEEVVKRAGVAKGTFFAHFHDKDALMDILIGAEIDSYLDRIEACSPPRTIDDLLDALLPLLEFMSCERYVFDVILRHSGAAACDAIGPIAETFARHDAVVAEWLADGPFRSDVSPDLLAQGIQAFSVQSIALNFCAINNTVPLRTRLSEYLAAWLLPGSQSAAAHSAASA